MSPFQERLDRRRTELKLSYPELARRSGIPESTVYRILNRRMRRPPTHAQLEGLAKALDWPLVFLQQGVAESLGLHVALEDDPDFEILRGRYGELSPKSRKLLLEMAEQLVRHER